MKFVFKAVYDINYLPKIKAIIKPSTITHIKSVLYGSNIIVFEFIKKIRKGA